MIVIRIKLLNNWIGKKIKNKSEIIILTKWKKKKWNKIKKSKLKKRNKVDDIIFKTLKLFFADNEWQLKLKPITNWLKYSVCLKRALPRSGKAETSASPRLWMECYYEPSRRSLNVRRGGYGLPGSPYLSLLMPISLQNVTFWTLPMAKSRFSLWRH